MNSTPLVIIRCITYNHEPYIRQCLDGFVMQKTNFPFHAVVHDDASTDKTASIVREYAEKYPNIIHPIFETENQYSKHDGSLRRIMDEACKDAKYIAICEGDDYWIDPLKLQKQVDFLESHDEYVLCAHNSITIGSNGEMGCFNGWLDKTEYDYEDIILKDWFLPTQSLLYRREVAVKNRIDRRFYNGDYCTQLCLTRSGGLVHYSNECMGVYRRNVGISKYVNDYDNNLGLIELLLYMKDLSDERYWKMFDDRIASLKKRNEYYQQVEKYKKNGKKLWYRMRFRLLICFSKLLRLKRPSVVIYKNYYF